MSPDERKFRLSATVTRNDLNEEWNKVIGNRRMISTIVADFGIDEPKVAQLTFEPRYNYSGDDCYDDDEVSFEVGIIERDAPYVRMYIGTDQEEACACFMCEVVECSG